MKKAIPVAFVILLVAALSISLGASQKGGLPALAARVQKLEAQVAGLISKVGSLSKDLGTLKSAVSSLQDKVSKLGTSVLNLKGQNNWAVVDSSANVFRHSGISNVTSAKLGKGAYQVTFGNKDVTGCAYTATIGDVGAAFVAPGFITVSGGAKTVNDVEVQTFDKDGVPADSAFHLYLSCP